MATKFNLATNYVIDFLRNNKLVRDELYTYISRVARIMDTSENQRPIVRGLIQKFTELSPETEEQILTNCDWIVILHKILAKPT